VEAAGAGGFFREEVGACGRRSEKGGGGAKNLAPGAVCEGAKRWPRWRGEKDGESIKSRVREKNKWSGSAREFRARARVYE